MDKRVSAKDFWIVISLCPNNLDFIPLSASDTFRLRLEEILHWDNHQSKETNEEREKLANLQEEMNKKMNKKNNKQSHWKNYARKY